MRRLTFVGARRAAAVTTVRTYSRLDAAIVDTSCLTFDHEGEPFYDRAGVHDRYTAHRENWRLSPNCVIGGTRGPGRGG